MGKLEPSHQGSTPIPAPSPPENAHIHETSETREPEVLARRVGRALNANLERGFLESEERFRQIAETLQDVVFLTNADLSAIKYVNTAYENIWGRTREELYGEPLAFLKGVHPDDRERVRDAVTRGSAYDLEFRVIRPDGDLRWVWTRGFPVRGPDETFSRIAGIAEDITDRKLIAASHERLIRGFTHDVKNPLGTADGYLSLLEDGYLGQLSAEQAAAITRSRRSIRTALDLVIKLLDIERAQTGTLDLQRARFDAGPMLRDLMEDFRAAANARQLDSALIAPSEELVVYSDPTRVRQIIGNLISNAVKYTKPGGTMSVKARVAYEDDAPTRTPAIAIEVADSGPGIPLEKQHLLFKEFSRFSPDEAEGSGLGLAISQHLARALDGSITFATTPGVGSTFTLWLPVDRRVTPPVTSP